MTTATRPLPPHGSYARANGCPRYREPCKCEPCLKIRRRTRKRMQVNRQLGKGALIDATQTRAHLHLLRQTMTWNQIAAAANCETHNLQSIYFERQTTVRRATQTRILAVQPQPVTSPGMYLDATGIRRRLQALRAIGYSVIVLAEAAESARTRIELISTGKQLTVRHQLASKILRLYAALAEAPAPPGRSSSMAKRHAAANGWAPPAAWDDDTIDDPNAVPDWTGHCGTDRGWWMHKQHDLPMCQRCETAHADWLAERRHLPHSERFRELGIARGEASNRGAAIAHDGRELMRLGCDYDQAAARIGVTRQHLQQELVRHPEPARLTAA